jgi:hypothetical protein
LYSILYFNHSTKASTFKGWARVPGLATFVFIFGDYQGHEGVLAHVYVFVLCHFLDQGDTS